MLEIQQDATLCTVIVTVDADPPTITALRSHAELGLRRFPEYSGFLGGALHVSADRGRLVQYLQWSSEADYEACRDDPAWDALPSTRAFLNTLASGRARLHASTYRVVAVSRS